MCQLTASWMQGALNIHSLLSKNRDKVTDLMLHLLFLLLLFIDGQNRIHEHGHFKVSHADGAEKFSTTTIELLSPKAAASFIRMA